MPLPSSYAPYMAIIGAPLSRNGYDPLPEYEMSLLSIIWKHGPAF